MILLNTLYTFNTKDKVRNMASKVNLLEKQDDVELDLEDANIGE